MIPFHHKGHLIECARPGQPIYLHHCPVCGGKEEMLVMLPGSPRLEVISCPQCTSDRGLHRVLRGES